MGTAPFVPSAKLPGETNTQPPHQRLRAVERLKRLEEAKAFLRQQLAGGPQPARVTLKAARAAGIAARTLHRAKDALGITPVRSGGYGAHGKWTWYPPRAADLMVSLPERPMPVRRG